MENVPLEDYARYPSSECRAGETIIILKDDKIVGFGTIGSSRGDGTFHTYYNADTMPFAREDWAVATLGKHAAFKFFAVLGEPAQTYTDEPEGRNEDLRIVDMMAFAFGYASKARFGHIPGFGVHDREDPLYYENQVKAYAETLNSTASLEV